MIGGQNSDRGYINFGQSPGNALGATTGGALLWCGRQLVDYYSVETGQLLSRRYALNTHLGIVCGTPNRVGNGLRGCLSFTGTFADNADILPRRCADITGGYTGGAWGSEVLEFRVGGATDSFNVCTTRATLNASGQALCNR